MYTFLYADEYAEQILSWFSVSGFAKFEIYLGIHVLKLIKWSWV